MYIKYLLIDLGRSIGECFKYVFSKKFRRQCKRNSQLIERMEANRQYRARINRQVDLIREGLK